MVSTMNVGWASLSGRLDKMVQLAQRPFRKICWTSQRMFSPTYGLLRVEPGEVISVTKARINKKLGL